MQLQRIGARILAEANDLKRTPVEIARELGIGLDELLSVIEGRSPVDKAREVVLAISRIYPVSFSDMWVDDDNSESAVFIMRSKTSELSARSFSRLDRNKSKTPYYEYRDTAMARGAPFKPEWISMLRVVNDSDADNPDVAFNKGHLLHQLTFFIGPINFYWELDGKRYCYEMNTGDSNFIMPFVPHSFTRRDQRTPGVILAITYGAGIRRALNEFGRFSPTDACTLAGDLRHPGIFRVRLRRFMDEEMLEENAVLERLIATGIRRDDAVNLINGNASVAAHLKELAKILRVRPKDLDCVPLKSGGEVVITVKDQGYFRLHPRDGGPQYQIRDLARHETQPHMKAFELEVIGTNGTVVQHSLHEYIYNYGEAPVCLKWDECSSAILQKDDSVYIRPMVKHSFSRLPTERAPHLVVMRVPGAVTSDVFDEYAAFDTAGRSRAILETNQWF